MITYIDIHTHQTSSNSEVVSYLTYDNGIHPWKANQPYSPLDLTKWYIGEIGLDKKCDTDFETQKIVFLKQLKEIVQAPHIPIFIHSVSAHQEILHLISKYQITNPVIFHGFIGNEIEMNQIIKCGHFISFGMKTFDSKKTQCALKEIPLNRLFLESDTSSRNIIDLYDFTSNLKEIELNTIKSEIFNNYKEIIGRA